MSSNSNSNRRTVDLNPKADVSDPQAAIKIQLEILQQRCQIALKALTRGERVKYAEALKGMKHAMTRVHRLSYLPTIENNVSNDDKRLLHTFRMASYASSGVVQLAGENLVEINGTFEIDTLNKYACW